MKQKTSTIILMVLAFLVAVAISGCTSGPGASSPSAVATTASPSNTGSNAGPSGSTNYNITITGGNVSPVTVTYSDLMSMGRVEMKNATLVKMNGWLVASDWSGVPMEAILAKAGVPDGNVTFKMSAPDGFEMAYTRDELKGAMLGIERNGTMLNDDVNGDWPIQVVEPEQIGHMWIKVPVSIEMIKN